MQPNVAGVGGRKAEVKKVLWKSLLFTEGGRRGGGERGKEIECSGL